MPSQLGTKKSTVGSASEETLPEVSPLATFARVTLIFLEDWQAGRITPDEVCKTLRAAAVARNFIKVTEKS